MTNTLPVYKGYTVDFRLNEFRKMEYGKMPKTIKFNSKQGIKLLREYCEV
jgi:hypothetical protein